MKADGEFWTAFLQTKTKIGVKYISSKNQLRTPLVLHCFTAARYHIRTLGTSQRSTCHKVF